MKTLTEQYRLIKEDKGHKGVFLKEAKAKYPNLLTNSSTFKEATTILKQKNIISENYVDLQPINNPIERKKEGFENAFANFLAEAEAKAEEKKVTKEVEEDASKNYDTADKKDPNNMIFGQIQMGYYFEMKQEKNADKTIDEIKDIVFKNLEKDPIYYTKNGQFGVEVGYTEDNVSLGVPKEPKGEYKSSGYGKVEGESKFKYVVNENKEPNSKLSPEEAASLVANKAIDKLINNEDLKNIADKISKDPKASKQLMAMLGKMNLNLNENEVNVDPMDVKKIALAFAKKAEKENPVNEYEYDNPTGEYEGGFDAGGAFFAGGAIGGTLANYLASMNDVITPMMRHLGQSPGHMAATIAGAIGGAALLVIGKMIYDKNKNKNESYSPINEIAIAGGLVTGGGFTSQNYMDFYGLNEADDDAAEAAKVADEAERAKTAVDAIASTKMFEGDSLQENYEEQIADALSSQAEEILRAAEERGEELDIDKALDKVFEMSSIRDLLKQHLEIFVRDLM